MDHIVYLHKTQCHDIIMDFSRCFDDLILIVRLYYNIHWTQLFPCVFHFIRNVVNLQSSPTSRASSQSPHAYRSGGSSSGSFSFATSMPYNLLPSSQKKAQIIPNVTSTAVLSEVGIVKICSLFDF